MPDRFFDPLTAVMVTYGSRADLAISSVLAAFAAGVERLVLVNNGSAPASKSQLRAYAGGSDDRLILAHVAVNEGSAGGFARGLEEARKVGAQWVLLLDDDNVLASDALDLLAASLTEHGATVSESTSAFVLHRPQDLAQSRLLAGVPINVAYNRPGSFIWLDVRNKLASRNSVTGAIPPLPTVPSAPYGGLLMHTSMIGSVGLPRRDLVLYQDDTEFTERLVAAGVQLLLCPDAIITDTDGRPAPEHGTKGGISTLLEDTGQASWRTYYTVRNCVWLDRRRAHGRFIDRLIFTVNAFVYSGALLLKSVGRPARWPIAATVLRGIRDGLTSRLGVGADLPTTAR
jgi:GT2 family glycosyltransferase